MWTWKKLAIKKNDVFNVGFTFILHFHKPIFHNFRYCGLGLVKHKRKGSSKVNNLKCPYALLLISYYNYVFSFPFLFFFLNKDEKLKWEIMGYSCTLWWKWWVEIVFYFSFQQCLSQVSPKLLIFFAIMISITNIKNWYFDFNVTLISSK